MRIIDINATLGYVPGRTEPPDTVESLLRQMDIAGVESAVAFYNRSIVQIMPGNRDMQEMADNSNGRIKACWLLHPYMDGVQLPEPEKLLQLLKEKRPAAVRLMPLQGRYLLNDFYCDELLEILRTLRIPVLINYRSDMDYPLEILPKITEEYPEIPFVLTDAYHKSSVLVRTMLRKRKNVYIPVSYMCGASELDQLVNTFGPDQFLFGSSDGNVQGGALGLVYQGRFSPEAKEAIFSGNWVRLQEGIQWGL
jgi:predicted TIM-barrel fold metal-dependent hydrolase